MSSCLSIQYIFLGDFFLLWSLSLYNVFSSQLPNGPFINGDQIKALLDSLLLASQLNEYEMQSPLGLWVVQSCNNSRNVLFSSSFWMIKLQFLFPFSFYNTFCLVSYFPPSRTPFIGCLAPFLIPGQTSAFWPIPLKSSIQLACSHFVDSTCYGIILPRVFPGINWNLKWSICYQIRIFAFFAVRVGTVTDFVSTLARASQLDKKHELCTYWVDPAVGIIPSETVHCKHYLVLDIEAYSTFPF